VRQHLILFINGREHRIAGADAFLTVSDFLRLRLKLCGTKIVCSEGDCGSCTVLCGRCSPVTVPDQHEFVYVPIDSCIRFMFQLDGCHLITVEGLSGIAKSGPQQTESKATSSGHCNMAKNCGTKPALNGVQQAMIECHGSQCGFCTPGFVVAMTGLLESNPQPTEDDWRHGLTGNLCRCTGYSPIIRAGETSNRANTPPLNELYPASEMLAKLAAAADEEFQIDFRHDASVQPISADQLVYSPKTIKQATDFLATHPKAIIVAGATDIGVRFNKGTLTTKPTLPLAKPQPMIWLDLTRVEKLRSLSIESDTITAGACASWSDMEQLAKQQFPEFHKIVAVFGSPQIRHVGTIGGNIINASPIADSVPFLFVCDAELEISSRSGTRTVNINDFYLGYKQFDLRPGELLTRITIPLPPKTSQPSRAASNEQLRLYKVSRRRDLDISTFTAAIRITLDGDTITRAAIAYGAVGPVVLRLPETESFLQGKTFTLATMQQAGDHAVQEITPLSDVRGGEAYRFQLARNVLLKFFHECRNENERERHSAGVCL